MRVTSDSRGNIANIRLREKAGEVISVRLSDESIMDIAPDGPVSGIELLNANAPLDSSLHSSSTGSSRQAVDPRDAPKGEEQGGRFHPGEGRVSFTLSAGAER